VSSVIIGATKPEQLQDNLKTTGWTLTPEEVAALDAISVPPRLYPNWMLDFTRLDRQDPSMIM
jgi:aryl-alcohol dehydrogenase-like predicted oxidoreductase